MLCFGISSYTQSMIAIQDFNYFLEIQAKSALWKCCSHASLKYFVKLNLLETNIKPTETALHIVSHGMTQRQSTNSRLPCLGLSTCTFLCTCYGSLYLKAVT